MTQACECRPQRKSRCSSSRPVEAMIPSASYGRLSRVLLSVYVHHAGRLQGVPAELKDRVERRVA